MGFMKLLNWETLQSSEVLRNSMVIRVCGDWNASLVCQIPFSPAAQSHNRTTDWIVTRTHHCWWWNTRNDFLDVKKINTGYRKSGKLSFSRCIQILLCIPAVYPEMVSCEAPDRIIIAHSEWCIFQKVGKIIFPYDPAYPDINRK